MARAASRRPAAQPPVRRCSTSTCCGDSRSPDCSSSCAAWAGVNASCAARSSRNLPRSRNRESDNGGSSRLDSTSCRVAGLIRVRISTPCRATGSTSSCTSSRIKRSGCGSACTASASSARNSGWAPARHAHRPCNRLDCGTDGQPAIAATTAAHNRLGSLSSRSTPTQAVSTPVLVRDQSASNNVFPYPAGAQTKASSAPAPASRPAHSSARATNPDGSDGTVIFTRGTSTTAITPVARPFRMPSSFPVVSIPAS